MGKIIRQKTAYIEKEGKKIPLISKGEFYIEFALDRLGPYEYLFDKKATYYNFDIKDRGTILFPLKQKDFNNTEIFLENDDIVIAIGQRKSLSGKEKTFVDVINLQTEKSQRIFADEVSLVYFGKENGKEIVVINYNNNGEWKTVKLDAQTIEVLEEKGEKLLPFFKVFYNQTKDRWYKLDFIPQNPKLKDLDQKKYQQGWFEAKSLQISGKPVKWDREKFEVQLDNGKILDVWEASV